jgi:antitoxin ParD1/3/4
MTVTLTKEQESLVKEQLESGHFKSIDEVITQGLEMVKAQEAFIRENVVELRKKIATGLDQIRRGEVLDGEAAIANVRKKLARYERGEQ